MIRSFFALTLAIAISTPAFAKGPWLTGTFQAPNPLYRNSTITLRFEDNRPVSLVHRGTYTATMDSLELTPANTSHFGFDGSFSYTLQGHDPIGINFEARLVAGSGEVDSFVLILPSGVQTVATKQ